MPKVSKDNLDLKDLVAHPGWQALLERVREWQEGDRQHLLEQAGLPVALLARGAYLRAQDFLDLAADLASEREPEPEPEVLVDDGF